MAEAEASVATEVAMEGREEAGRPEEEEMAVEVSPVVETAKERVEERSEAAATAAEQLQRGEVAALEGEGATAAGLPVQSADKVRA